MSFRRNHGPNLFSRQENLLAKRLAGWGIGEECNPAVTDFSFFTMVSLKDQLEITCSSSFQMTGQISTIYLKKLGFMRPLEIIARMVQLGKGVKYKKDEKK